MKISIQKYNITICSVDSEEITKEQIIKLVSLGFTISRHYQVSPELVAQHRASIEDILLLKQQAL